MPIRCIIVSEYECDGEVFEFETEAEFAAFTEGVDAASELYGCGSCFTVCESDLDIYLQDGKDGLPFVKAIREHLLKPQS